MEEGEGCNVSREGRDEMSRGRGEEREEPAIEPVPFPFQLAGYIVSLRVCTAFSA